MDERIRLPDIWNVGKGKKSVLGKRSTSFKEGQKVKFIECWDVFPNGSVKKGETGKITVVDSEMISVKLDIHHSWLDYWGNEVHFYTDDLERNPEDYIKVVKR